MGLLTFIREAGEKLFQMGKPEEVAAAAPQDLEALNQKAADAIKGYIKTQNLDAQDLAVSFDGATQTVTVSGTAADQATREKIVLCCGNVGSVEHVDDQMTVAAASEEARYYTVKSGDTLSKISKEMYGDANKYNVIFEANKPMLKNPDRIYPGQMLRVPPESA
ncbi:MAG: peptidoglycan-binding protein LysM [Pseudomonadota bacterium]